MQEFLENQETEEAFIETLENAEIECVLDGTCNSQKCGRCHSKVF